MTNHAQLLATPAEADGTLRLLQRVGRRYVQFVNSSYRRSGTLWEGRYKASLIDSEHYLMCCYLSPETANQLSSARQAEEDDA